MRDLAGWGLIEVGESDTSVYRRGDVFAKCCGVAGVADLLAERNRVQWLAGGLPGAAVVDWLESGDGACLLTSAVPGVPGAALPTSVARLVVCHGDACLPNVFFDPATLEVTGLIDVGRLGIADRYSDLALTTIQLVDEWSADSAPFLSAYGLADPDQRRLRFFRLLDPLTWG